MKRFISKAKNVLCSTKTVVMGAFATIIASSRMTCDGWKALANDKGFIEVFNNIGTIYMKWAWFFGAIGIVCWFVFGANDKKSAVAKGVVLGVCAGYIIFAFGGNVISSLFYMISDSFG